MNEEKIKKAFQKVKLDISSLKEELEEVKSLKSSKGNSTFLKKIKEELKENRKVIEELKQKLDSFHNDGNSNLDMNKINEKLEEIVQMLDEKLELEISNLKLEFTTNLARLEQKVYELSSNDSVESQSNIEEKVKNTLTEFSEIVDEKIQAEVASLKLEYTNEIAKIYDTVFNEFMEFKKEIEGLKSNKKSVKSKEIKSESKKKDTKKLKKTSDKKKKEKKSEKKEEVKEELLYESQFEPKEKESKLKKIAKWLFVDEEEEFEDIKDQIKNNK
jgi:hypothetical protein